MANSNGSSTAQHTHLSAGLKELRDLAGELSTAADHCEMQLKQRSSDPSGTAETGRMFAHQAVQKAADAMVCIAGIFEQQLADQTEQLKALEDQASLIEQHLRINKLAEAQAKAQMCVTQLPTRRVEKWFEINGKDANDTAVDHLTSRAVVEAYSAAA